MRFFQQLKQEGVVHATSYSSEQKRKVDNGRAPDQSKVDICLNCTKEKCTGTILCFKKQRQKAEK